MKSIRFLLCWIAASAASQSLIFVTIEQEPFAWGRNNSLQGFLLDVLDALMKEGSVFPLLKHTIHLVADGAFGYQTSSGAWTGLIGQVISGAAEAAVAPLSMTEDRMEVVDFSIPFMLTGVSALTTKSRKETSISQLLNNPHLKFSCIAKGSTHQFFKKSGNGLVKKLNLRMIKNGTYFKTYKEGLEAVEKSQDGNLVFFGEDESNQYNSGKRCLLKRIGPPINTIAYAIAVKKNSNLKIDFDKAILSLGFKGGLRDLQRKWWKRECAEDQTVVCGQRRNAVVQLSSILVAIFLCSQF